MAQQELDDTLVLLQDAMDGRHASLEGLFRRYLPYVRRIAAYRMTRKVEELIEVEDLVQEAMMRAFRSFESFRGRSVPQFRSWLATCVATSLSSQWRRTTAEKRKAGAEVRFADIESVNLRDSLFADREPSPSFVAIQEEGLQRALFGLPEDQREIITLRGIAGMSFEEIAQELGLGSAGSARALWSRAMARFTASL